jgi:hypothetical protein
MMQSQYSAVEADGLGQWGAIAAAAMSAASSVYAAQQQKQGIAAQVKAQKEIAKMAQQVELEKVKLMKRQAEMANAPSVFASPGGGMSTGAIVGIAGAGVAVIILVAMLAKRKRK